MSRVTGETGPPHLGHKVWGQHLRRASSPSQPRGGKWGPWIMCIMVHGTNLIPHSISIHGHWTHFPLLGKDWDKNKALINKPKLARMSWSFRTLTLGSINREKNVWEVGLKYLLTTVPCLKYSTNLIHSLLPLSYPVRLTFSSSARPTLNVFARLTYSWGVNWSVFLGEKKTYSKTKPVNLYWKNIWLDPKTNFREIANISFEAASKFWLLECELVFFCRSIRDISMVRHIEKRWPDWQIRISIFYQHTPKTPKEAYSVAGVLAMQKRGQQITKNVWT